MIWSKIFGHNSDFRRKFQFQFKKKLLFLDKFRVETFDSLSKKFNFWTKNLQIITKFRFQNFRFFANFR